MFRVERLSERVLLLTENSPMENTVVALKSRKGLVVIDTLGSPISAAAARKIIEETFGRRDFIYVVNTHQHWDHVWGNQAFEGATVVGFQAARSGERRTPSAAQIVDRFRRQIPELEARLKSASGKDRPAIEQGLAWRRRIVAGLDTGFRLTPPTLTFDDRRTIELGDLTLNLVFFGRAHSEEDILIHVPQEKLLFTGDLFLDRSWMPLFAGQDGLDVPRWIKTLDSALAQDLKTVIPGHCELWPPAKLRIWRDYIVNLWDGVKSARRDGLDLAGAQKRLPAPASILYFKELGRSDADIERFHQRNIEAFWRQLDRFPASASFTGNGQSLGEGESWYVQLADLNGDGRLDAYFEGAAWFNDGQGRFTRGGLSFCTDKESPVYFGDLNGDGTVDALCENKLYFNDGKFHFEQKGALPTDVAMLSARLADLNGDGRIDVIAAGQSEDRVLLNNGKGGFTDTKKSLGGWAQCAYAVGDLNGDGAVDVYVGIPHTPPPDMGPANDKLWLGDGKGGFREAPFPIRTAATRGVALADFNGDGRLDLFVTSQIRGSSVYFNDGKGGFTDASPPLEAASGGPAIAADFDQDGFTDVFVVRGGPMDNGMPNLLWLNDGKGKFTDSGLRLGASNSLGAAAGDLNGDGKPDLFVANLKNVVTKKGTAFNEVWLNTAGGLTEKVDD